jgi:hypothetical protein
MRFSPWMVEQSAVQFFVAKIKGAEYAPLPESVDIGV